VKIKRVTKPWTFAEFAVEKGSKWDFMTSLRMFSSGCEPERETPHSSSSSSSSSSRIVAVLLAFLDELFALEAAFRFDAPVAVLVGVEGVTASAAFASSGLLSSATSSAVRNRLPGPRGRLIAWLCLDS
jgi:hypothetical protein